MLVEHVILEEKRVDERNGIRREAATLRAPRVAIMSSLPRNSNADGFLLCDCLARNSLRQLVIEARINSLWFIARRSKCGSLTGI